MYEKWESRVQEVGVYDPLSSPPTPPPPFESVLLVAISQGSTRNNFYMRADESKIGLSKMCSLFFFINNVNNVML